MSLHHPFAQTPRRPTNMPGWRSDYRGEGAEVDNTSAKEVALESEEYFGELVEKGETKVLR